MCRAKRFQKRGRDGHLPAAFRGVSVEVGERGDLILGCNVQNAAGTTHELFVGDHLRERVEGSVPRNRTVDAGRVEGAQRIGLHHLLGVRACRLGNEIGIVCFGDISGRVERAEGEDSAFICICEASNLSRSPVGILRLTCSGQKWNFDRDCLRLNRDEFAVHEWPQTCRLESENRNDRLRAAQFLDRFGLEA